MPLPWYVVTGVPSSGKTSVLGYLELQNYCVFPEAARTIIDHDNRKGINTEVVRKDELHFQRRVLKLKRYFERIAPRDQVVFFDRGFHETLGYYEFNGFDPAEVKKYLFPRVYTRIFILDPLPYEEDPARTENPEDFPRLQELLRESYERFDYELVEVPIMSVEERGKFILDKL